MLFLSIAALAVTFYALCIICDDFMIPAVDVFIHQFQVPEELAAVTLVAFGSASPELFISSVGALQRKSDLSIAAILGSGLIAFGLIPPLCILCDRHDGIELKLVPILRESLFYGVGLSLFLFALQDQLVDTFEAFCIASVYCGMVFVTYYGSVKSPRQPSAETDEAGRPRRAESINRSLDDLENHPLLALQAVRIENEIRRSNSTSPKSSLPGVSELPLQRHVEDVDLMVSPSSDSGLWKRMQHAVHMTCYSPIKGILSMIIPSLHPNGDATSSLVPNDSGAVDLQLVPLWRACAALILCFVLMGASTGLIVNLSMSIVAQLHIETATLGATLVAFGSEIPDILSSVALAKNGYHDGAIASAIGSQVINISLGVGLPTLYLCLTGDGAMAVPGHNGRSIVLLSSLLVIVIFTNVAVAMPLDYVCQRCSLPSTTVVTKMKSMLQLLVWVAVYVVFLCNNE